METASKSTQLMAKEMSTAFSSVNNAIEKSMGFIAALAAGAGFAKMIDSAAEWNIENFKMAKTMGITTEESSVLDVALHKLGIGHDVAEAAALRLSRSLATGTDKFDQFNIKVKDAQLHLLPMPEIIANVNQALKETKSGADRNVIAVTLYGRSWDKLQDIYRLTQDRMRDAKETAERLHLIVGPEGVARSIEYKEKLREIDLVGKSLAIQLGNELMPAVISVASALGEQGVTGATTFGRAIKELVRDTQEAGVYWGEFFDRFALKSKTLFTKGWFGIFSDDYKKELAYIENAATAQLVEIAKNYDRKPAKSDGPAGGGKNTLNINSPAITAADPNSDYLNLVKANNQKYLQYENAFLEEKAAAIKHANDLEELMNQNAFDTGLTDLKTYLEEKTALNEEELFAEVVAKQKKLKLAKRESREADVAYKKDPTGDAALHLNDSYLKVAQAVKAVEEAESKLALARQGNVFETAAKIQEDELKKGSAMVTWAEQREAARESDLAKSADFYAMVAELSGNSTQTQMAQIEKEKKAWMDSWATKVGSLKEYEQRKAAIEDYYNKISVTGFQKGIQDTIRAWGDSVKQMEDLGKQMADALQKGFSDIFFDAMQGKVKSFGEYLKSFAATLERALSDMLSKSLVALLSGDTSGSGSAIGGVLGYLFNFFFGGGSTPTSAIGNPSMGNPVLTCASGTDYFPRTGLALIHQGEKIIPAGQNRASSKITVIVNNQTGEKMDADASNVKFDVEGLIVETIIKKSKSSPGFRNILAGNH